VFWPGLRSSPYSDLHQASRNVIIPHEYIHGGFPVCSKWNKISFPKQEGNSVFYFLISLAFSLMAVMFASLRSQFKLDQNGDIVGLTRLLIPIDKEQLMELFDPAVEWQLSRKTRPEFFRQIQINRRALAIRCAVNMIQNAVILQRLGYAAKESGNAEEVKKGKLLIDTAVPVRMRSALLLLFLYVQKFLCAGSNLSSLKSIVNDLIPDWDTLVFVAAHFAESISPELRTELVRHLSPTTNEAAQ
jgi:hypothetical protein